MLDSVFCVKSNPVEFRKRANFAEAEPVFSEFLTGIELIKFFASAKFVPEGQIETLTKGMNLQN